MLPTLAVLILSMRGDSLELAELFEYSPNTGEVRWRISKGTVKAGSICGTPQSRGYLTVCLNGRQEMLHRIAWRLYHGEIPADCQIDHINGNKHDNRIANLRLASCSQNLANRDVTSRNKLGIKGVSRAGKKYRAQLSCKGRRYAVYCDTLEAAIGEYERMAKEHHGEYAHTGRPMVEGR